jgi:hypothetical protein
MIMLFDLWDPPQSPNLVVLKECMKYAHTLKPFNVI